MLQRTKVLASALVLTTASALGTVSAGIDDNFGKFTRGENQRTIIKIDKEQKQKIIKAIKNNRPKLIELVKKIKSNHGNKYKSVNRVPEPSSLVLFLMGGTAAGLVYLRRRKHR